MQTSKARSGSSEVPQKTSPRTPRTTRQPKVALPESDSATSRRSTSRTPTEKSSPKPIWKTPKSPASEKKRVSRVSELEAQLIQAQEDLKKTKELLSSCESCKKQALEEVDDAKKQYSTMAADLEDAKRQLLELSGSEGPEELQKLPQECERALQLKLEALQKQNSVDAADLASAMSEIQNLKLQIEMVVVGAQAKQAEQAHMELEVLKQDMVETISVVGTLRAELNEYEKSEAEYEELLSETQIQLQVAHATIKTLHSDGVGAMDSLKCVCSELEISKIQITTLEDNINAVYSEVECLRSELKEAENRLEEEHVKSMMQIRSAEDIANTLRSEVEQLKSAMEEADTKLEEERIKNTMQAQAAYELQNSVKIEPGLKESKQELALKQDNDRIEELREDLIEKESELQRILDFNESLKEEIKSLRSNEPVSEMESKLMMSMADVAELKSKLMDKETELRVILTHKETELHRISSLNERLKEEILRLKAVPTEPNLESKLEMSMAEVAELKANLMDKETELQGIAEENMVLKEEVEKRVEEMHKSIESATAELEAAKASEKAALTRLGHATDEAEKNSRRAAIVAEQLEAAQTTNCEIETELKRLRIQSEQWRKAAEAAASILATGNNGQLMERSGSMDSDYLQYGGKLLSSPYSDDLDDDSPKKKKNNVLKKLGVLWKKGQK
ncbi:hypothetical protein Taro_003147 [Colocasia esculenta]|uniref:Interactor of constitutive active ROPs 3 n=1 Tax=Colocasia esculenta TaxID=4460 RepID=A0A843TMQ1_COLES|nr:hypothetical protein [Colocasia esculenta]